MGLRKYLLAALVTVAFAGLQAAPALASRVSVTGTGASKTLKVTAVEGEGANDFHVSRTIVPPDFYVVSDSHAIDFSAPCVAGTTLIPPQPAGTVACPVADIATIKIAGKDGDDSETIESSVTGTVKGDLAGHEGDDTLQGGPTDDHFAGGIGADVFAGGAGTDTVEFAGHRTPTRVTIGAGTNNDGSITDASDGDPGKRDNVQADIENVIGGRANDRLTGDGDANRLKGGPGNDWLQGGEGADVLKGGPGRGDAVSYKKHLGGVTVDIDNVADDGNAAEDLSGDNVGKDVEKVYGSNQADILTGDGDPNRLAGRDGADRLSGMGGADSINGFDGGDDLRGGSGRDRLEGRAGEDSLRGQGADDVLLGGGGADVFFGSAGNDVILARDGVADKSIRCGSGRKDTVVSDRSSPRDPPRHGCERRL